VPVETTKFEDDVDAGKRLAAVRMVGWRGITEPFTPENALRLCYSNPLVAAQVTENSDNTANFNSGLIEHLLEFAESEFKLSQNAEGSSETERAVLESLAWQAGKQVSDLVKIVEKPDLLDLLVALVCRFKQRARSNGFGLNPLDSTKLKDWCWRTGIIRRGGRWKLLYG